jgi:hypothetical protein
MSQPVRNTDELPAGPVDRRVGRLQRKLEKRDQRIAGLERRVVLLERAVAARDSLPRDLTRVVQEALCNVRMIPVIGVGKNARIVEVKASDA